MLDYQATRPIQHGGNQSAIRARLGLGDRPLLDFSAPLNALGPPPGSLAAVREATEAIDRYPDPGSPRLIARLAEYHGISPDRIIVGAGTTELIGLIGQMYRESLGRAGRDPAQSDIPLAHLVEPTYGEYRRTSAQNGLSTRIWGEHALGWIQDDEPEGASGIFWTGHPNNPTGRAWERSRLLGLIKRNPTLLTVVDEAYLPFLPDEDERSVIPDAAELDNLIVLRSMTKIFAFPGLRIGYAVAAPELINRLRRSQQPWSVTTAAEYAAIAALDDDEYLARTIEYIGIESARLTDRLWDIPGLRPAWPGRERPDWAPSMPNFVLVSLVGTAWTSTQLQDALARSGLFARECTNYRGLEVGSVVSGPDRRFETRGHLRFCVRTPSENDRLLATLSKILATRPPA
ncbi:pyridoxal phosphate-dependent aminotransferase [Tundrisphaera lichenicola]|uniref:pyridoxal phosphate-dependent aminotransferase n=1 Tax=Tundrisphaera lichenicola TaxID=2029860 RepID=UPI003EBEAD3D